MKKVLVLFSGGKDSFLSSCKLIEEGYEVFLVTYENGCGLGSENVKHGAERIISRYGEDRVHFLGVYNTVSIWREFFLPFMNMTPTKILEEYGEISYSQFNCLTCRSSMYVYSIALCKILGINNICDGARYSQQFAIETKPLLSRYEEILKTFDITLLLPVVNIESNWELKNELLLRGFIPKTLESQCLLGVPLSSDGISETEIRGIGTFFDKEITKKIPLLVQKVENMLQFNKEIKTFI